ncbi:hypothetical protein PUN28_008023 [Cardiocondyla obscurior]|uniref:Uncharacterized protein n=1 Tax=Cardiocondyla obscurior TaxID=286306 RepID=A0AAW2FVN5_9HYME
MQLTSGHGVTLRPTGAAPPALISGNISVESRVNIRDVKLSRLIMPGEYAASNVASGAVRRSVARLLGHNAHKRMSAVLKPITNYGLPHSLTARVKTEFPVAVPVVTTVEARLSNSLLLYKNRIFSVPCVLKGTREILSARRRSKPTGSRARTPSFHDWQTLRMSWASPASGRNTFLRLMGSETLVKETPLFANA